MENKIFLLYIWLGIFFLIFFYPHVLTDLYIQLQKLKFFLIISFFQTHLGRSLLTIYHILDKRLEDKEFRYQFTEMVVFSFLIALVLRIIEFLYYSFF